jgi:hypothetical protein
MNKSTKTRLENKFAKFHLQISNFQYFSGKGYKASFDVRYYKEHNDTFYNSSMVVPRGETYEQAIDMAINW